MDKNLNNKMNKLLLFLNYLASSLENLSSGFPTRSDTNWAVQPQKMAIGLKFQIKEVEGLYYPCSENKAADQLRSVTAQLICVFVFAYTESRFFLMTRLICIQTRFILDFNYIENAFSKASVCAVWSFMVRQLEKLGKTINLRRTNNAPITDLTHNMAFSLI